MKKNNFSIIWDWNGTIVNDSFVFIKIMNGFLKERGLPFISLEDYKKFFVFPVQDYYKTLGFDFSKESFNALSLEFIKQYKKHMFTPLLVKNMRQLLFYLNEAEVLQFVVSAQESSLLKKAVEHYKLKGFFSDIQGTNDYRATSKIAVAQKTFNQHLKKSKKIILIGDTEHDAEVARALNIDCCLVSYGHCTRKKLRQTSFPVVDSVKELKAILLDY